MAHPVFFDHALAVAQSIALQSVQDYPPEAWWLPALVLLVLGASATVDALTGTVPDWIIALGLAAVLLAQGVIIDWSFAETHLRLAAEAGIGLWALNYLWQQVFKGDAYGMGDAKWTMLAVSCFDFPPLLFAWGCGACLAIIWMCGAFAARKPVDKVYFGPFLFIGLLIGLYWLRLR